MNTVKWQGVVGAAFVGLGATLLMDSIGAAIGLILTILGTVQVLVTDLRQR